MINILIYPNYNSDLKNNKFKELIDEYKGKKYKFIYITKKDTNLKGLICCNYYDDFLKKFYKDSPIIIFDRMDCTSVNGKNRVALLENNNILGLYKEYTFKDPKMYFQKFKYNRYHLHVIDGDYDKIESLESRSDLIKPMTWNLYQYSFVKNKTMDKLREMKINHKDKNIDIFYICHSHEKIPSLYKHRKTLAESLIKICNRNNLKYEIHFDENIKKSDYLDYLVKSKICIAPYGLGERIALEQMALFSETAVVKPDMSFVSTIPNIYTEEYMNFFNPNLQDGGISQEKEIESIILKLLTFNLEKITSIRKEKIMNYNINYYLNYFIKEIESYEKTGLL